MRSLSLLAIICGLISLGGFSTLHGQSDECDVATFIDVSAGAGVYTAAFDTTTATDSANPAPTIPCSGTFFGALSNDVWWEFTSPFDGIAELHTCGVAGDLDTDLVIYEGSDCTTMIEVACNGDEVILTGCQAFYSHIQFVPVIGGLTYKIRLGSFGAGASGTGTLTLALVVPSPEICDDGLDNDSDGFVDCFDADCVGNPSCFEGDSVTCSDGVDNDGDGTTDCADVDCSGISPCGLESDFCDDGIDNDGDGLIDCADVIDCPFGSPACLAAGNDECDGAFEIGPVVGYGTYTGFIDTTLASDSANPMPTIPCDVLGSLSNDVWHSFTPDADGAITVHSCDAAGFDTDVVVYEDSLFDCTSLVEVGCNGDSQILTGCQIFYSHITGIPVIGGQTYKIRTGAYGLGVTGTNTLTVEFFSISPEICDDGIDNDGDGLIDCADPVDCPFGIPPCDAAGNDECDGASLIDVSAGAGTYTAFFDTTLASDSAYPAPAIPCDVLGALSNDVWFEFTSAVDAVAELHTCGVAGDLDTDLVVYEGSDCTALTEIACNGDAGILAGCQAYYSHVQFVQLSAGLTYKVRIGAWSAGDTGTGTLTIAMVVPAVEDCTNGVDDDLDGNIDCLDPDCFTDPNCAYTDGDECFVALDVFEGANLIDTTTFTTGADPVDYGLCAGTFGGAMASDGWYRWVATSDADYWIHTCDPAAWDTDVIVYEGACDALVPVACNGDDGAGLVTGCQAFFSFIEFTALAGTEYMIRVGSFGAGGGTGTLNIVPLLCPPMAGLASTSDCVTGDVTLSWTGNAYDTVDILRDSVLIDSVPGTDTSYVDPGLASGTYQYTVQGICGGNIGGSQIVTTNVASYGGEPHVIFALEAADQIDSVAALQAALDANGVSYVTTTLGPAAWGCLGSDSLQCAWMMTGTWPNDYRITDADGAALATAVENGKGVYFEAGDHWGFVHLVTNYDNYDGVDQGVVVDGDDSFVAMDGFDSGFGLDTSDLSGTAYNQASAGNDYTDQINALAGAAGPNVAQIWANAGGGYGTGNFYATDDPFGNTISQSWEFGGFGGDQVDLAARYLAVLCGGGTPPGDNFTRGDCNADGGFNIADQIFILAALFSGGAAGVCADACDENDDGGINIADGIYGLAALFSGGPPPPAPSPGVCGVDATDTDALDCASFPPCP